MANFTSVEMVTLVAARLERDVDCDRALSLSEVARSSRLRSDGSGKANSRRGVRAGRFGFSTEMSDGLIADGKGIIK
jgi:hypothetical protein